MTLNVTLATRKVIYQMGDFRLTNLITHKYEDRTAQKQILVQRFDWTALVAFAGVGRTRNLSVSDWLAEKVSNIPMDASIETLITRLLEADQWLSSVSTKYRRHTFTIGAFVGSRPLTVLVSNFESIDGRREPTARNQMYVTRSRPSRPRITLAGQGAASVTAKDNSRLIGLLRSNAPTKAIHDALAELNERVAALDASVSPGCFTSHLTVDGKSEGMPHGIGPQQEYSPEFALEALKKLGLKLNPAKDEAGRPKPIQLVGMTGVRSASSEDEFRARLKENPKDPELLNNYGAYLKDIKRDAVRAEQYYRKALDQNPDHAAALNNLANALWERGEQDEAQRLYERSVQVSPNNALFLVNYANFLTEARQDFDRADEHYRRALEQNANDAYALGWHANFLYRRGADPATVQAAYERVFQLTPNHPVFRNNYANFLRYAQQDYSGAAQEYEKALTQDPNSEASLINYLSLTLTYGADYAKATELSRRLLKLRPNDVGILSNYAFALSRSHAPDKEIEKYYRAALQASPSHPNTLANFAQYLWTHRRDPEALELCNRCLASGPSDDVALEAWFYLYAHSEGSRPKALGALKALIKRGVRSPGWDFSENVGRSAQDNHPDKGLVQQLAGVISGDNSADVLAQFSGWRDGS